MVNKRGLGIATRPDVTDYLLPEFHKVGRELYYYACYSESVTKTDSENRGRILAASIIQAAFRRPRVIAEANRILQKVIQGELIPERLKPEVHPMDIDRSHALGLLGNFPIVVYTKDRQ
jgi:hypothetical protein